MQQRLQQWLNQQRQQDRYRSRRTLTSAQATRVICDGRELLNFSSNDYLGLASHPELKRAMHEAVARYGCGSGASHLICGHSEQHELLEQELAEFVGRERALVFSTGYMANLGVITALLQQGDRIFEDKLNHASLLDAGLASGARFRRYLHGDTAQLGRLLSIGGSSAAQQQSGETLIVTDGVFSMDGDIAPLEQLAELAQRHHAWLMVDDAHGFGVLGKTGAGCIEQAGLGQAQVPILMGTLGKACGSFGAFIAGSELLIETLIQRARSYIYTTALPPAVAAASRTALQLIRTEPQRRQRLQALITRFCKHAQAAKLNLLPSSTAIQSVVIGDNAAAMAAADRLMERGLLVQAIRPPTVAEGTARLRVTLTSEHSEQDIDSLVTALAAVVDKQNFQAVT